MLHFYKRCSEEFIKKKKKKERNTRTQTLLCINIISRSPKLSFKQFQISQPLLNHWIFSFFYLRPYSISLNLSRSLLNIFAQHWGFFMSQNNAWKELIKKVDYWAPLIRFFWMQPGIYPLVNSLCDFDVYQNRRTSGWDFSLAYFPSLIVCILCRNHCKILKFPQHFRLFQVFWSAPLSLPLRSLIALP